MAGYFSNSIDFSAIQRDIDAARYLSDAGRDDMANEVINSMADKIKKQERENND